MPLEHLLCERERAVATDTEERIETAVGDALRGFGAAVAGQHLAGFVAQRAPFLVAQDHLEGVALVGRPEDRPAVRMDVLHLGFTKAHEGRAGGRAALAEEGVEAVDEADDLGPVLADGRQGRAADGCVETGGVAAAGEDADSLHERS